MKLLASILAEAEILAKAPSYHEASSEGWRTHCHAYRKFLRELLSLHSFHHNDREDFISVGSGRVALIVRACNFSEVGRELFLLERDGGELTIISRDLTGVLIPSVVVNLLPQVRDKIENSELQIVFATTDYWGKRNLEAFRPARGRKYIELVGGEFVPMAVSIESASSLEELDKVIECAHRIAWLREDENGLILGVIRKELLKEKSEEFNSLFQDNRQRHHKYGVSGNGLILPSLFESRGIFSSVGSSLQRHSLGAFSKYGDFSEAITGSGLEELVERIFLILRGV